ncbi:tetratricopeptide repeat protein [Bradyrhizobium zhanjiangense]|uniref:Tetratricopeptide repeat protein 38 n=1 Tax=Bradyrhizobium zhanjiangense TaxID=1325107 RepID=A0ABY0DMD9_9BRAD|nr:tetratricopeptide repeat protein [Bradyrhizobium zhanjiangense]RXG96198.1 tetratricopeptide repeat protein [Bradyrhizobium zhanjiangense]
MAECDSRGLPISTESPQAAGQYRIGIDLLLSAWPGADDTLRQAAELDPHFALAHAALARLHAIKAEPAEARARIATAQEIVARNGSPREISHVAVLALAVTGQSAKALESALAHLDAWPRDVLILSLPLGAFGLFAFSGMIGHDQARVDLCERVAGRYDADDWWFLTYRGWSHAENGSVSRGRDLAQRGLERRRANANAAHAVAHAMFEQGAKDEAEKLLDGWLPEYDRAGMLHGHLAWHAALSALERDDPQHALAIYSKYVRPSASLGLPINVLSDTVSLLWRLQAYGHEVPSGMWEEVESYAGSRYPTPGLAFVELHTALLAAATGKHAAAVDRIKANAQRVADGVLPAGPVVPAIGRAALAFANTDYAECMRILEPVAADVARVGGSGAQREIIEDMLLLAFMRSGDSAKARDLLDRRLHRRPSQRDARWRGQIEV